MTSTYTCFNCTKEQYALLDILTNEEVVRRTVNVCKECHTMLLKLNIATLCECPQSSNIKMNEWMVSHYLGISYRKDEDPVEYST